MAIKKLNLCWITVSDIEKSKVFFKDTCGLDLLEGSSAEHRWLEFAGKEHGGLVLGVAQLDGSQASQSIKNQTGVNAVVTMSVDDIVAEKASMEKKGVKFVGEIQEVPGIVKMATFLDPDNNTFQLVQDIEKKHTCC